MSGCIHNPPCHRIGRERAEKAEADAARLRGKILEIGKCLRLAESVADWDEDSPCAAEIAEAKRLISEALSGMTVPRPPKDEGETP